MVPAEARSRLGLAVALLTTALLAACVQAPKPLYHWDTFARQQYDYMRGDGTTIAEQMAALEKQVQTAQTAGLPLPPGARAHLGIVYLKLGRDADAKRKFEEERAAFPESAPFMDFLLARMSGPKS